MLIIFLSFQCKLDHVFKDDTFSGHLKSFFSTVWDAFTYMLGHSYVSLTGALLLLAAAISFVPFKVSRKRRAIIGILHVSAHLAAALILMLLLEVGISINSFNIITTKVTSGEIFVFIQLWTSEKASANAHAICILGCVYF